MRGPAARDDAACDVRRPGSRAGAAVGRPTRRDGPRALTRVFFSDSGSIAVEVALKIALQYWRNRGEIGKDRFLCFTNGYHGDTFGAMAVSDPERSMHKAFRGALAEQLVVDIPTDASSLADLDSMLSRVADRAAA